MVGRVSGGSVLVEDGVEAGAVRLRLVGGGVLVGG